MVASSIFTVTGPSGVGKNKVSEGLLAVPDLGLTKLITCTTRTRREGEMNGRDYHFVDREEFLRMIQAGEMAEYAEVYGTNLYGSRKADVKRALDAGQNALFQLDIQGATSMKTSFTDRNVTIFLAPKNIDELLLRLNGRGTDSTAVIRQRIEHAEYELSRAREFDYVVVNAQDRLSYTIGEVSDLIRSEIAKRR